MKRDLQMLRRLLMLAMLSLYTSGCITYAHKYIPASRVPPQLLAESKQDRLPINLSLLGQPQPSEYILGAGDVVGVFVQGVIPTKADEIPLVTGNQSLTREYYPPNGSLNTPATGVPIQVQPDGTLPLPLVNRVRVAGLTLGKCAEEIRAAYLAKSILQENRDRIYLVLLRPRTTRVLVIREDTGTEVPQQSVKGAVVFARRGRAETIDLPAFENDVLHALTATGGLPGIDGYNELWVLRSSRFPASEIVRNAKTKIDAGDVPDRVLAELQMQTAAIRIPLRNCANEAVPFSQQDVILQDGDIVFIAPRENEYFYTGGLLPGGQIPLPRDHDVDVVEAVAIAQGSIGGPGGVSGSAIFRTGAGPGNVVPPTRVLIVRKLPNGQQVPIRCDLARALHNPQERILVQPGDLVMLQYKPHEMAENIVLNFFNWSFTGVYSFQN